MHFQEVTPERTMLVELAYDEPLASELAAFAEAAGLESAWVLGTGAVRDVELAVYDQDELAERSVSLDEPLAMPLFTGTVTTAGETPQAHLHGVFARPSGQALAGRLSSATVFGAEAMVWELAESIERETDETTGMHALNL